MKLAKLTRTVVYIPVRFDTSPFASHLSIIERIVSHVTRSLTNPLKSSVI